MGVTVNAQVESKAFNWKEWQKGILPALEPHSEKKLQLLRDYLVLYLKILCQRNLGKTTFPISIVDGFAGGALYSGHKDGSPLVLLKAIEEAEFEVNRGRQIHIKIQPIFYFIEENKYAFECLNHQIRNSIYSPTIGVSTFLFRGKFNQHIGAVLADIKRRHPRGGGRSMFFLDQCGYSKVSPKTIHKIHTELSSKAEFIVNFAIGWLADTLNDASDFKKIIADFDLSEYVNLVEILAIKARLSDWRYLIEAKFGEAFRKASGLPFFSPFYIEPVDNHRGYWLLHLAPVARARFAMTQIHWQNANGSKHYGPKGLGILGYKPDGDDTLYLNGMSFDVDTRTECKEALVTDLAKVIRSQFKDGTTVQELSIHCCNDTIADISMLKAALASLSEREDIVVLSGGGNEKRSQSINDTDIIQSNRQFRLSF